MNFCPVLEWINANKLSLNVTKTNYMLFSNAITSLPGNISINDTNIVFVEHTQFLGLYIDCKLNWKMYVSNLCKFYQEILVLSTHLNTSFPLTFRQNLYSTLIFPYLYYGILAWGNCSKTNFIVYWSFKKEL